MFVEECKPVELKENEIKQDMIIAYCSIFTKKIISRIHQIDISDGSPNYTLYWEESNVRLGATRNIRNLFKVNSVSPGYQLTTTYCLERGM